MATASIPLTGSAMSSSEPQRSTSVHSAASISSNATGTSLIRRSRTRTRSKTVTGASSSRSNTQGSQPSLHSSTPSDLAYLDDTVVQDPLPVAPMKSEITDFLVTADGVPERPPRSPQRLFVEETIFHDALVAAVESPDILHERESSSKTIAALDIANSTKHQVTLPGLATLSQSNPPRSAFPKDPSFTEITRAPGGSNFRDSVQTQHSTTCSSIYPPSTSTPSGTDSSPYPRSIAPQEETNDVSSFDPEQEEPQEFDTDEVSYRLRLLVKNSYFLPPAHAKPSPSDFHTFNLNTTKKSPRVISPGFMDIFRVGKSKSKLDTPPANQLSEALAPVLRTTSDSTTASGHVQRPPPRTIPPGPLTQTQMSMPQDRVGRVVVVREKMGDLASAAKQAELEMKARGGRREYEPQREQKDTFDDVIDPTDVVDLPPPSAGYPFAVQASALHGLGVKESVGAALLADRLPPPTSPGMSSLDREDFAWRKALLHEAVGHSLDNSLSTSFEASTPTTPPPETPQVARTVSSKRALGQRILSQTLLQGDSVEPPAVLDDVLASRVSHLRNRHGVGLSVLDASGEAVRPSSFIPRRAETPAALPVPLAPAPRRPISDTRCSQSQSELPDQELSLSTGLSSVSQVIRRTVSSPRLLGAYEVDMRQFVMTPPPAPTVGTARRLPSQVYASSSFETSRAVDSIVVNTDSHYSDDEGTRPSTTVSASQSDARPSLSVSMYSQPSPTASAFQDALDHSYHSSNSSQQGRPYPQSPPGSRGSPQPRFSTMSPPPRVSSSISTTPLTPPPRSSSLHYSSFRLARPPAIRPSLSSISDPEHSTPRLTTQPRFPPEPTPPFYISDRRTGPATAPLPLQIPIGHIPAEIHSAPPPSSPTSFFDRMEAQHNAMDDLDSSDEDASEDEVEAAGRGRGGRQSFDSHTHASAPFSNPMPSFMRLGNLSTPYVSRQMEEPVTRPMEARRPSLPFGRMDPRRPIGNVPTRAPYFAERRSGKSDHGHRPPVSTFDFYNYTRTHPMNKNEPSTDPRPSISASENARSLHGGQEAQESLRRLDGMLMQHMEAEKDTIKRITTSALHARQ